MDNEFDLAIVGMACRLPGASSLDEFWRNLAGGVESIARLSDDEIRKSGVPASYLGQQAYVKASPVLAEPGHFDAAYFGFSPAEARAMDPQHRILLELAHEALEHAGCDASRFEGRVGVFTGAAMNTYFADRGLDRRMAQEYIPTLIVNDKDFLSTRISYKLNLKGPSLTVQTACSTSLVAVHLARQSLLSGESDMALAGAISVRVPHRAGYFADAGGVTSPDGHVRAFDAGANGTVFGSGGGIIVLKRLSDALAAGDTIHAVIKGSAVNNDGAEKAGYTAPSVNSQADAVVEALANAGVDADSIGYVEAHGSGTPVGDPIEIAALTKAFRSSTARSGYCAIGSVKSNIGHLDAAAGIAGLIKTVLALKHREIPPTLHYSTPNPEIDFASTPFHVNAQRAPWPSAGPRRAGVMATGMGGTNAHVVLEEAAAAPAAAADSGAPNLLLLSARTATALDAATAGLHGFLKDASARMDDVAFTLQTGRKNLPHRRFLVCSGRDDAVAGLAEKSKRQVSSQAGDGRRPLILLLPGVGDHFVGMGHDLYEHFEVFRREIDRCAWIVEPLLGADIRKILYPDSRSWKSSGAGGIDLKKMLAGRGAATEDPDTQKLNRTLYTQPAQFAVEYALARLWMDLGAAPQAIVGHSMGEYVAACLAGVLSLEDALRLIVKRTQLVDQLPSGRMLAVTLSEEELLPLLGAGLSISLINGPKLCVVAGAGDAVAKLEAALAAKGVICRPVQNTHAFHSRMLDPIVGAFEQEVRKVQLNEPKIPYISNVSGTWITKAQATDPAYWASHTNHTARFSDALRVLWRYSDPILLEAGPGKTIGVLAMQHPDRKNAGNPTVLSSSRHHYENRNDVDFLLHTVGALWAAGADIRWSRLHQDQPRHKVPLPTYPFERQEYWIENDDAARESSAAPSERTGIDGWFYLPAWERTPAAVARAADAGKASWLVIARQRKDAEGFKRKLEEQGAKVRVASFGGKYRHAEPGSFEVDPASSEDYLSLLREIRAELGASLNVLHLGCLAAERDSTDAAARSRDQDLGFFSLLHLAQAVGELGITTPVRIGVVSDRVHEVTGEEAVDPGMATVLGPIGVIPKEFPSIACFNVDLQSPKLDEAAIARILSEFGQADPSGVTAYRGKYRWRRKYEPVRLPERGDAEPARLRQRGVYLITGGTGGIGLAISKYLAAAFRARIVLTKKADFPAKSEWKDLAASSTTPPGVARTLRELLEIEKAGGEVEVVVAEASDPKQMRRAIDATLKKFGCINGVFHAAGIVRAGLIQAKSREAARNVMSPKVEGTWLLHDLLAGVGVDFLVLFSSITSVITPYAEADYAGANSFLDAFAAYSNARRNYRTFCINWPGWREVGQLADLETQPGTERWKQYALSKAILTKDGMEALKRILSAEHTQVVVSPHALQAEIEHATQPASELLAIKRTAGAGGKLAEEDRPSTEAEEVVAGIWMDVFGLEQIGVHQMFASLGGHSLIAMQIVAKVRTAYGIELSLRDFFAAPTIAGLSAAVEQRVLRDIESMSDEEASRLVQAMKADGAS